MNLPNKLTVIRVAMIPLFLFFFFWQDYFLGVSHMMWALIVFAAAALTDMLDGQIARKYNLVTNFGKLMDPLADKLLVMSAFICIMCAPGYVPVSTIIGWYIFRSDGNAFPLICLVIIMAREFIVTSVRLVAAEKGVVIAADIFGKLKTVAQMSWICVELLAFSVMHNSNRMSSDIVLWADIVLFAAMLLLTVFSGFNYIWKNRGLFADS